MYVKKQVTKISKDAQSVNHSLRQIEIGTLLKAPYTYLLGSWSHAQIHVS